MDSSPQSNDYYYQNRAHHSYYETLLKDYEPMQLWRQILSFNPLQIRDRVILDIGSGPGIFSLLAARAGARHVYAWEPSVQSRYSERIISDNRFSDIITVLTGPIETIEIPDQVDVLFTSAFGFFLYQDSLIPQFVYARTHFLKPDGVILPSRYSFSLCCCSASHFPLTSFWKDVYGFDYSPIEHEIVNSPFRTLVATSRIVTNTAVLVEGTFEVTEESGITNREFEIVANKEKEISGFVIWFEVFYELPRQTLVLSTSPMSPDTHWMQICLPLGEKIGVCVGDRIHGKVMIVPELPQYKRVKVAIEYGVNNGESITKNYLYQ
jgi:protein arginine N-methyltransferase 1